MQPSCGTVWSRDCEMFWAVSSARIAAIVASEATGLREKSQRPALLIPVSYVVQPSAYATVGLPPMTTAHSYSPLASGADCRCSSKPKLASEK